MQATVPTVILHHQWSNTCYDVLKISIKEARQRAAGRKPHTKSQNPLPIKQGADPGICAQGDLRLVWGWSWNVGKEQQEIAKSNLPYGWKAQSMDLFN